MFIYVLPLEIQLSRGEGWNPINRLTLPHFYACPKPWPGFPKSYDKVFLVYSELRWKVIARFVDIGWIVDRPCLNFLFRVYPMESKWVIVL
jgi:hypothetical protein